MTATLTELAGDPWVDYSLPQLRVDIPLMSRPKKGERSTFAILLSAKQTCDPEIAN